jgi:hypothetical protein
MKVRFPENAEDGTIFEAAEGIFYQYNRKENSWIKVDGFIITEEPATALAPGLMESEDLRKLNDLLLPPPHTSMTSPQCGFTFESGVFGFRSSQEHLHIEHEVVLRDRDEQGFEVDRREVWKIHENTYGINFRVNVPKLLTEIEAQGNLAYRKTVGQRGPKGQTGANGIDNLETGPKGIKGDDGANYPFSGFLSAEQTGFLIGDGNRGITDVRMEEVSADENYLVVTRAIIGNADLCPAFVKPKKLDSKWITVVDERPPQRIIVDECDPTICGVIQCAPDARSGIVQSFCSTRLYFLDMQPIEEIIRTQFENLVTELKTTKEQVTLELMKAMIDLFTEQKLSLCCAYENCLSRRENQRHRNIIDSARIQAAQAGFSIIVDGEDRRNYQDTDPDKDCPPDEEEEEAIINEEPTPETGETPPPDPLEYLTFNVKSSPVGSGTIVGGNPPSTVYGETVELPAGEYKAEFLQIAASVGSVTGCFFTGLGVDERTYESLKQNPDSLDPSFSKIFNQMKPYNRRFKFYWQTNQGESVFEHPNTGDYRDKQQCWNRNQAIVDSFEFTHTGGTVRFEYTGYSSQQDEFSLVTSETEEVRQDNLRRLLQAQLENAERFGIELNPAIVGRAEQIIAGKAAPFRGSFSYGGAVSLHLIRLDEPEPTATEGIRQACEPFETDVTLTAAENSFKYTREDLGQTASAVTIIPTAKETQTGKPVELELPSAGTFDIELISGAYFDAKIVNGEYGLVCLDPCVIKRGDAIRNLEPGEAIPDGWQIVPQGGVTPRTEMRFTGGYLVTQEMYQAAVDNDEQSFATALTDSGNVINQDPEFYNGLENALFPDEVDVDVDRLMSDIRSRFRPYDNGRVAVKYEGYETEQDTRSKTVMQAFASRGGFISSEDAEANSAGQKIRVVVADPPVLELHINEVELRNQNGTINPKDTSIDFVQPIRSPNAGEVLLRVACVQPEYTDCQEPILRTKIDCKYRDKEPNALSVILDADEYVVTISNCCCLGGNGYEGRIALKHRGVNGEEVLTNPRLGDFDDESDAREYYVGNSFSFQHMGGELKIWVPETNMQSGTMEIEIQTADCFDAEQIIGTAVTAADDEIFGDFQPCDMSLDQIMFYQFGWKAKACCGAHVEVGGTEWLVVKRSIGDDTTCGGGESIVTDCIREGLRVGIHPAVAFPTIDGVHFFGKPTGGFQRFFREVNLESIMIAKIKAGESISTVNSPEDNIDSIIFPYEM